MITAAVSADVCYLKRVTNNVVVPDRYVTWRASCSLPLPDAANNQAQWTHAIAAAANLWR
ncbi:MAG: hypothetical protein R2856_06860 [Caldilineaceae bacterium]